MFSKEEVVSHLQMLSLVTKWLKICCRFFIVIDSFSIWCVCEVNCIFMRIHFHSQFIHMSNTLASLFHRPGWKVRPSSRGKRSSSYFMHLKCSPPAQPFTLRSIGKRWCCKFAYFIFISAQPWLHSLIRETFAAGKSLQQHRKMMNREINLRC